MPGPQLPGRLTIFNAQLLPGQFKNFGGEGRKYNLKGNRNFGVKIDPALVDDLLRDGWNIKMLKPQESDEDQIETPWLKVNVNYNSSKPPRIVLMSGPNNENRTEIREDIVDILDGINMENIDLVINPSSYEVNPAMGGTGISAYLKTAFIKIEEDDVERKYSILPNDAPSHNPMLED